VYNLLLFSVFFNPMSADTMAEGVTGKANSTVYDLQLHNSAASYPALSLLSL
jgi:hypothetical protein